MSILSGIKNLFTGGAVSPDKIADTIVSTGDALFFTSEERSESEQKRFETWLDLQKTLAKECTPRSVNRRVVAWTVMFMMAALTVACIVFRAVGAVELSDYTVDTAVKFYWPWAFCGVIVFYFGPHMMSSLRR